jgi:hypothetical protein
MKESRNELAWYKSKLRVLIMQMAQTDKQPAIRDNLLSHKILRKLLTLWRSARIFITKIHLNLVDASFPIRSLFARDSSFPSPRRRRTTRLGAVIVDYRPRPKTNRMIAAPGFAFFAKTALRNGG